MAVPKLHIIAIPELDSAEGAFQLALETRKHPLTGALVSTAKGQYTKAGVIYAGLEDFHKTYLNSRGQCTQRRIDEQHAEVFNGATLQEIIAEVKAFYAKKSPVGFNKRGLKTEACR